MRQGREAAALGPGGRGAAGSAAGSSGRAGAASLWRRRAGPERLLPRGDRRDGVWEAAVLVLRRLSLENSGNGRKMCERNTVMDCGKS